MDFLSFFPSDYRNSIKIYFGNKQSNNMEFFKDSIFQYTAVLNDIEYADYFFLDVNSVNQKVIFEAYNNLTIDGVKKLQEDVFAERFYTIAQDKRWSQYFYIVCENEDIFQSIADVFKIQQEMNFGFKNVIKREEIEEIPVFLDFNDFARDDNSARIDINIYSIWEKELGKIGLSQFISKPSILDAAINKYLEQDEILPDTLKKNENKVKKEPSKISKIDSIILNNYRTCYEKDFSMHFCDNINIFYGVNGAGKTGILEAIELAITGKNNRVPQDNTSEMLISVNSGNMVFKSSSSPQVRKNMDAAWYHSSRENRDKLNDNFCTFNFFHTYKTRDLQDSKDLGRDIISRLTNLVFSQDALQDERNINNLLNNFKEAKKRIDNEKKNTLLELERLNGYLEVTRGPIDIGLSEVIEQININFRVKIDTPKSSDDSIGVIDTILQPLLFSLSFFDESILGENEESLSVLVLDKEKLYVQAKAKREELIRCLEVLAKTKNDKSVQEQSLKEIAAAIEYFSKETYIENYRTVLIESKLNVENIQKILNPLNNALNSRSWLKDLKIAEMDDAAKNIIINEKENTQLDEINEKEMGILVLELKKLETSMKEVDELNSQLRVLGMKKLNQDTLSNKCPMCEHEYANRQELLDAIGKVLDSTSPVTHIYQSLFNKKADFEKQKLLFKEKSSELKQKKEDLQAVIKLIEAYKALPFEYDFAQCNLFDFAGKMSLVLAQNKEQKLQLESAECFYVILRKVNCNFNKNNIIQCLNAEKERLLSEIIKSDSLILDYEKQVSGLFCFSEDFIGNRKTEFEKVQKYNDTLKVVLEKTNFKSTDSIVVIKNTIFAINKLCQDAKEKLVKQKNANAILKRIEEETEIQRKHDKKLNRIKIVVDTISKLPKTKDLCANYIEANKNKIEKLFKLIHKPREFKDLVIEDKRIVINRKIAGGKEEVTDSNHMSMGQQISLALAVMLTLHFSAEDAPNILMLDEPIANLDDLHFINMLDILRRIAILGKQIFITTASSDIAAAMRRKFSVFKKGYGHFEMERENGQYVRIFRNKVDPIYENVERIEMKKDS